MAISLPWCRLAPFIELQEGLPGSITAPQLVITMTVCMTGCSLTFQLSSPEVFGLSTENLQKSQSLHDLIIVSTRSHFKFLESTDIASHFHIVLTLTLFSLFIQTLHGIKLDTQPTVQHISECRIWNPPLKCRGRRGTFEQRGLEKADKQCIMN